LASLSDIPVRWDSRVAPMPYLSSTSNTMHAAIGYGDIIEKTKQVVPHHAPELRLLELRSLHDRHVGCMLIEIRRRSINPAIEGCALLQNAHAWTT
jgi:hypothetical protein